MTILWVDDDPNILEAAERLLRGQGWTFTGVTDVMRAKDLLMQQNSYSVLVADQIMSQLSGVDLLEFAKKQAPHTTRVLLTGRVQTKVLEEAVNRAGVFRFIAKPWENSELLSDIAASIEHHRLRSTQANLLREVSRQNKRLEDMTSGLEQIVTERTEHSELSKNEVENKLARMRQLIRFIKELSLATSIDELMTLIKKEIKSFHGVRSFMLGYLAAERKPVLLFFQGKQVTDKKVHAPWPKSSRLRVNEIEDRKYLANEFGRPIGKVIAIPLQRKSDQNSEAPATLFFEHTFNDKEVEPFLQRMAESMQPLSIALDRVLLEYNLKYTSFQWESTFDGINDPIAIVDIDYKLVRSNRHFHGKHTGVECHKVFVQSESPCQGCPVRAALHSGQPQKGQIRVQTKAAGVRTYDVLSYPIKLQGDQTASNVINHYVDVTNARELQGRVVQNEKMAAIGSLAGNIAHELNNPLTGIRSLAQVIIHEINETNEANAEPNQKQVRDDLKEVEQAAERSQTIIKNLLEFSRGETTNKQVNIQMNDVVARTLPMLKTAMRDHRNDISLSQDDTTVKAEPSMLQQVVFNLVNNACQAMVEIGQIKIETRTTKDAEGMQWVEIDIADTGSGIPLEIRESIFEPFFTTKEVGRGTGLGLSMSRSIIQQFGGEILLHSEVGKGTCFTVRLPRIKIQ